MTYSSLERRRGRWIPLVALAFFAWGCSGDPGAVGPAGPAGPAGEAGQAGAAGEAGTAGTPGTNAVDKGTIQGSVRDAAGVKVAGVTVTTEPVTTTVTTDANGAFTLKDIAVGSYRLTALLAGKGAATLVVGVAGGSTTNVSLELSTDGLPALATLEGKVVNVKAAGIAGATVTVQGQTVSATTAADGTFKLVDVKAGFVFLEIAPPAGETYLAGGPRRAINAAAGTTVTGLELVLSSRPSDSATYTGGTTCEGCHTAKHPTIVAGVKAAAHARFVTEGTSHLVHPELWPAPGAKYLPRDPKGKLLLVQDPLDGTGLVHLVLCTRGSGASREFLFKFYPEQATGVLLTDADLDCADNTPANAVWIPVGGTIGGETAWGEGYNDPLHTQADKAHFGFGKQRYLAKLQDVPYLVTWFTANNVPIARAKQDYVAYMPVYLMQDGTPTGSAVLAAGDVGAPKFWQKSPAHWCTPDNTLSRNCAGCHTTGLTIEMKDIGTFKSVVTAFDYKDLNVSCERCHGPGSEHATSGDATKIIAPQHLTAKASNELCGQCHAAHAGKSISGIHKYGYDPAQKGHIGDGSFVPGVHALKDFYANYDKPTTNNLWTEGTFHTWADGTHSRAHSQQLPEMQRSVHTNNSYQKLTCASCHNSHSLAGSAPKATVGKHEFESPGYDDNALCLTCHATHGSFAAVTLDDVGVLQARAGRSVKVDGIAATYDALTQGQAMNRVGRAVAEHMQAHAGMGGALYTPELAASPVGRCTSCHMAKIGKLFDTNDDAQYHLALDSSGKSAVAEGNVGSHVFDIVWPAQSAVLKKDPATGHDYDIMPNSCGACHAFARLSGDLD